MNPIVLRKSLWNWFICFLFRNQLLPIKTDRGLELDLLQTLVIRDMPGKPIMGPKPGLFNWLIWAFFLNELDGVLGDSTWNPTREDSFMIRLKWWFRNPCHNLTWHVLGFAQTSSTRVDWQTDDGPGWNYAITLIKGADGKYTVYPYWLYLSPRIKYYFGWRGRGTFGIKFNIKSKA